MEEEVVEKSRIDGELAEFGKSRETSGKDGAEVLPRCSDPVIVSWSDLENPRQGRRR